MCHKSEKIVQTSRNTIILNCFPDVGDDLREVDAYFREVRAYFREASACFCLETSFPELRNKF